jgi:hypothetical protein
MKGIVHSLLCSQCIEPLVIKRPNAYFAGMHVGVVSWGISGVHADAPGLYGTRESPARTIG